MKIQMIIRIIFSVGLLIGVYGEIGTFTTIFATLVLFYTEFKK